MDRNFAPGARARAGFALAIVAALAVVGTSCRGGGPGRTTTTRPGPTTTGTTGTTLPSEVGRLPLTSNVDADGPFAVTVDGRAGANSTVFRPTNLGQDGIKHPIFVWGTGGGSQPASYTDHFTRLASHGFVVISPNSANVTGPLLRSSLDWIIAQNSAAGSVYNGKLNTGKVGMGGHSMGSIGTFAAEAVETRLTTTIHIGGGSFDGTGSSKVKTPTAYICGSADTLALSNCRRDFTNVRSQPTFFSVLTGVDHIMTAREALGGMNAWLRWHLNGETNRKAQFSPGGTFFQGIFQSQVKNW